MKRVLIHRKNKEDPIVIQDDNNQDLLEYTNHILSIYKSDKIVILCSTLKCVVIKPSQIESIEVVENDIITDGE